MFKNCYLPRGPSQLEVLDLLSMAPPNGVVYAEFT